MTTSPHDHADHGKCLQVLTELNDYADRTLALELCADLEAHLAQCENCRVVLDTLRKTIYLVHHLPEDEHTMPQGVEERLFATLHLEEYLPA